MCLFLELKQQFPHYTASRRKTSEDDELKKDKDTNKKRSTKLSKG